MGFVSVLAFFLCGHIAYGFMMLFDHTADTLLYCYAWNKKFEKDNGGCSVEDYLPESLRDIVDADLDERLAGKERQTALAAGSQAGLTGTSVSQRSQQAGGS